MASEIGPALPRFPLGVLNLGASVPDWQVVAASLPGDRCRARCAPEGPGVLAKKPADRRFPQHPNDLAAGLAVRPDFPPRT